MINLNKLGKKLNAIKRSQFSIDLLASVKYDESEINNFLGNISSQGGLVYAQSKSAETDRINTTNSVPTTNGYGTTSQQTYQPTYQQTSSNLPKINTYQV
ncbi:hypothetical protein YASMINEVIRUS_674 [Yasminevirus sp. GU-2018]|uniref:Uncharacterized protein n=1 Tax=Yasminevirus sp. GU-2018 TaxID=2420051 RepID=A0A5K0U9G6_9VIRU|nr:hypothetical protein YASMINEVIRUS_674 [Yasminevirus sp. GU-2018]